MTGVSATDLLIDGFERVRGVVHRVLEDASEEMLTFRIDPGANTAGWLVWHLTRVQDDHIADVAGGDQVWIAQGWHERFGLPFEPTATGYGQSDADVAAVRVPASLQTATARSRGPSRGTELPGRRRRTRPRPFRETRRRRRGRA